MIAFLLHSLTITAIYAVVVLGLQFAIGRGRVFFVAPTLFFAVGAYSVAILTTRCGWPVPAAAGMAVLLAWIAGASFGTISWRLRGDHLMLATLGLCEIMRSWLNNSDALTGGPIGIMAIPPIWPGLPPGKAPLLYLGVAAGALLVCLLFCRLLYPSPFGRIHAAQFGDEAGTAAVGRPIAQTRLRAICWGGMWCALGGALYASYSGYIDPSTFSVGEAMLLFAMVVIGGLDRPLGAVVGTAIVMLLPEGLRFLGLPERMADPTRRVVCGLVLLVLIRWRPEGLLGSSRNRGRDENVGAAQTGDRRACSEPA